MAVDVQRSTLPTVAECRRCRQPLCNKRRRAATRPRLEALRAGCPSIAGRSTGLSTGGEPNASLRVTFPNAGAGDVSVPREPGSTAAKRSRRVVSACPHRLASPREWRYFEREGEEHPACDHVRRCPSWPQRVRWWPRRLTAVYWPERRDRCCPDPRLPHLRPDGLHDCRAHPGRPGSFLGESRVYWERRQRERRPD